jgi:hypothetical protein
MSARERFNQLLDDVVAGVNDIASETDRPAHAEFTATAIAVLPLAISKLSPAERESALQGIEEGGALRRAVAMYPAPQAKRMVH